MKTQFKVGQRVRMKAIAAGDENFPDGLPEDNGIVLSVDKESETAIIEICGMDVTEPPLDQLSLVTETIEDLAKEFSKRLLKCIGKTKLKKVVELNKQQSDSTICHTHDFCDANQIIIDTYDHFKLSILNYTPDPLDNDKVWSLAKSNNFYITK